MKEEVKNFVEAYLDRKESNKDFESISFHIHKHIKVGCGFVSNKSEYHILKLDDEDINYLYKKYYSKLEEEMNNNLQEIKERYNKINSVVT